jgi:hypothetical protein
MGSRSFFFEDDLVFRCGLVGDAPAAMARPLAGVRGVDFFAAMGTSFGFAGFSPTPERSRRVMAVM